MTNKDTAICLRKTDFSETSQVVTFFAKDAGKLAALAKGSRRKKSSFDGAIEVFSYGHIVYTQTATAKLATLTEFAQMPIFQFLSRSLTSLNSGLFAVELLDYFTENYDPHPNLFDSIVHFLSDVQMASDTSSALRLLILFQLTLLSEVGTRPLLSRCANCKIPYGSDWPFYYFSSIANGLICPDCEYSFADKIRLSPQTASVLADLKTITEANERTLKEIENTLISHFTELMHRRPKMAKYFR
jgi:DNA repair protein RecO (recombination protein O)